MQEEDFPLYPFILKYVPQIKNDLAQSFQEASAGNEEAQYHFALALSRLAYAAPWQDAPGFTEDVRQKTLQSCLVIFDDLSGRGNENASRVAQAIRENYLDPAYEPEVAEEPLPPLPRMKPGHYKI